MALFGLTVQRAEQSEQAAASLVRRQRRRVAVAERHHAEAVAASGCYVAEGERNSVGDIGLAPVGGTEVHRG